MNVKTSGQQVSCMSQQWQNADTIYAPVADLVVLDGDANRFSAKGVGLGALHSSCLWPHAFGMRV